MRLGTSLRSRPAAATAAIAERLVPALGVRAVVDATTLDRLGLPVFFSLRPGSATQAVHSGKGLTALDARVGALMEAFELAVAEQASARARPVRVTVAHLAAQLPARLTFDDLAPRLGADRKPTRRLSALPCEDILTAETTLLPAELVLVPCRCAGPRPIFGWSSNGLASGNTRDEATLHGLLEVLERDTLAMNLAGDASRAIAHDDLPAPFAAKSREWRRIGIELLVRFVPNPFGLPCFEAALHDPGSRVVLLAVGSGLHFDRRIALARAICEAAQSRARVLYGVRAGNGDRGRAVRVSAVNREQQLALLARAWRATRRIDFDAVPDQRRRSVSAALLDLTTRLRGAGFPRIFRYDMEPQVDPALHVVKVVVPRCESAVERHVRAGPRLLTKVFQLRR